MRVLVDLPRDLFDLFEGIDGPEADELVYRLEAPVEHLARNGIAVVDDIDGTTEHIRKVLKKADAAGLDLTQLRKWLEHIPVTSREVAEKSGLPVYPGGSGGGAVVGFLRSLDHQKARSLLDAQARGDSGRPGQGMLNWQRLTPLIATSIEIQVADQYMAKESSLKNTEKLLTALGETAHALQVLVLAAPARNKADSAGKLDTLAEFHDLIRRDGPRRELGRQRVGGARTEIVLLALRRDPHHRFIQFKPATTLLPQQEPGYGETQYRPDKGVETLTKRVSETNNMPVEDPLDSVSPIESGDRDYCTLRLPNARELSIGLEITGHLHVEFTGGTFAELGPRNYGPDR